MSEVQLKAFREAVQSDASLQAKLNAAGDVETVVKIAKEAGFMITAEMLEIYQSNLSDEELENVAGGAGRGYTNQQGCRASAWFCK